MILSGHHSKPVLRKKAAELNKTAKQRRCGVSVTACSGLTPVGGAERAEVQAGLEGWNKSEGNRAQPGVRTT